MVQVSLDEMFDDTDQVGLTQETQFTATPLAPNTTVYLRVRAGSGTPEALAAALAGDYSGLALSDWTTHVTGMSNAPPPPPPPPMAPATPTGFMVESDHDVHHLESWDAVEGALGYAIQVSDGRDVRRHGPSRDSRWRRRSPRSRVRFLPGFDPVCAGGLWHGDPGGNCRRRSHGGRSSGLLAQRLDDPHDRHDGGDPAAATAADAGPGHRSRSRCRMTRTIANFMDCRR